MMVSGREVPGGVVPLLPVVRKRGNLACCAEDAIEGGGMVLSGVMARSGRRRISVVTIERWRASDGGRLEGSGLA